jgi:hypothetical protein
MRLVIPILTALAVISSSAQAKEEKTMAQSQEALSRAGIQAVVRSSYCKFEFESFLARDANAGARTSSAIMR